MRVGTKSVLFGAHCFFLHPWFVAFGWWKLYGFPIDPRVWVAFFVHDIGYLGKPNMDGPEGERHVELGARVMATLFDRTKTTLIPGTDIAIGRWGLFSLCHSRYYAKRVGLPLSLLTFADKLSIVYTPAWLYLPMVTATGEVREYLKQAQTADSGHWTPTGYDKRVWFAQLKRYMAQWVAEHKGGAADSWTNPDRHARDSSGVWQ